MRSSWAPPCLSWQALCRRQALLLAAAHLEDANLTKSGLTDLFVLVRLLELLDRDDLSGLLVAGLEDNAIGAANQIGGQWNALARLGRRCR